jgi:hypothetical protein
VAAQRYQLGSALRTRIRAAVGWENNQHATDAELDTQIEVAARQLLDVYLESYGPDPYRDQQEIVFDVADQVKDLDQQTYQVLGVYACKPTVESGGGGEFTTYTAALPWVQLPKFEEHERIHFLNVETSTLRALRYSLRGAQADGVYEDRDQIELLPTPTEPYLVRVVYIPTPILAAVGSGGGDVRVFAPGASAEWVVCYVAAYLRSKEKDDPSFFIGKMKDVEQAIRAQASRRDQNEPARMRGRRHNARHDLLDRDPLAPELYE